MVEPRQTPSSSCNRLDHRHHDHMKSTPQLRNQIQIVLRELRAACEERALFQEVWLFVRVALPSSEHDGQGKWKENPSQDLYDCDEIAHENVTTTTDGRPWGYIVNDIARLLPFMTTLEHVLACKLVSVCLLSYLLPYATPFSLVKDTTFGHHPTSSSPGSTHKDLSKMLREFKSLEEVLAQASRSKSSGCVLQDDSTKLQFDKLSSSFSNFVHHGLGPFLSGRPLPIPDISSSSGGRRTTGVAELLHVLAMAVSSELAPSFIVMDQAGHQLDQGTILPSLISCQQSLTIQIPSIHRAEVVQILADSLVLPETNLQQLLHQQNQYSLYGEVNDEIQVQIESVKDLLNGGICHLRASLRTYAFSTSSFVHRLDAKRALTNIAIDTVEESFVYYEMNALVKSLQEERHTIPRGCTCRRNNHNSQRKQERKTFIRRFVSETTFPSRSIFHPLSIQQKKQREQCIHCMTGDLLLTLILRYNGARHYADGEFTRQTLAQLTSAIATILGDIGFDDESKQATNGDADQNDTPRLPSSCQVASLLDCARALFYFLLHVDGVSNNSISEGNNENGDQVMIDEGQELENAMKTALIECAIQLLSSPDQCIAASASSLLSLAFAYGTSEGTLIHTKKLLGILKHILQEQTALSKGTFQDVITILSRRSCGFAHSLLSHIIAIFRSIHDDNKDSMKTKREYLSHIISYIAIVQPRIMLDHIEDIIQLCDMDHVSVVSKQDFVETFLSCQLAFNSFAGTKVLQWQEYAASRVRSFDDFWRLYKIARMAFCTCNFGLANQILHERLLCLSLSSSSYLWMRTLHHVAKMEERISNEGCQGIPTALPFLDSAIVSMKSFSNQSIVDSDEAFPIKPDGMHHLDRNAFQVEWLSRRKDFLNLCVIVQNLANKMQLTNSVGQGTRQCLHQRNAVNCFFMLSSRYVKMNAEFGMIYCQQTRTCIRNHFSVSRFMGSAIKAVFAEAFHGIDGADTRYAFLDDSQPWPKGDLSQPLIAVLRRLDDKLFQTLDENTEPKVRAKALLQILDLILKSPLPYPRGFMTMKSVPLVHVSLSGCPQSNFSSDEQSNGESNVEQFEYDVNESAEVIEVQTGAPFTLYAFGIIPEMYFQMIDLMFSQIVGYHTMTYDGPIAADDDIDERHVGTNNHTDDHNMSMSEESAFITSLLPSSSSIGEMGNDVRGSKFFSSFACAPIHQEGFYQVDLRVGLRDVRCGEYKLLKRQNTGVAFLKVQCGI